MYERQLPPPVPKLPSQRSVVVGRPGRRAKPHFPVHGRGTRFRGQIAGLRNRTDVDVDRLDRPQLAAPALVDRSPVVFQHPLAAAGDDAVVAPGRRDHQRSFVEGPGLGLLAIDILPVPAGLDHDEGVPVVRRAAVNGVNIGAGQQVAEVVVSLAVLAVVMAVHLVALAVANVFADVAHGDILHVAAAQEGPQVAAALVPQTDAAHHDPVAGRRTVALAQGRAGDEVRTGRRGGGRRLEKVSPIGTLFHGLHFLS